MNSLFLMDPLETVLPEHDTTFALMKAAHERQHNLYYVAENGLAIIENQVKITAQAVNITPNGPIAASDPIELNENEIHYFFIRTDPPFDDTYLEHTWLLDRLAQKIPVINHPNGIRSVNEKIWATQFSQFTPATAISSQKCHFKTFLNTHQKVILKPSNGFGGSGIFLISQDDANANVAFETLSNNEKKSVIMQEYLPEAQIGDKRILLLGGEPLGALLRIHGDDDHRNNMAAGGHFELAEISNKETKIIEALKPHLLELGLHFVGIDCIGDKLIEVNVTSPTCLQEMSRLSKQNLADTVIRYCETMI